MDEPAAAEGRPGEVDWRLVVHGGSGVLERGRLTETDDQGARAGLDRALQVGGDILAKGGSAVDAVEAAACVLEDDPHFNAGRGSVFTYQGTIEMDAAIMEGRDRSAGAVNGVRTTRNPIRLARAVKDKSPHVFLSGEGADLFSLQSGLEQADAEYFQTAERLEQLHRMRERPDGEFFDIDVKYGTVGAVAVDCQGHVAAATSTGGLTGKRWGRIGDSPVIGAGTFADDRGCAISATGSGEYFLRIGVAHEICARIRFARAARRAGAENPIDMLDTGQGEPGPRLTRAEVQRIADSVMAEVEDFGGSGGVIVVTPWGDSAFSFNTAGMYRGEASADGRFVAIYRDEAAPADGPGS